MAFLTDSSSHAHALTVQGGASWSTTTRKFGAGALDLTAAAFDGGIATPDSADWHLGSNSFTIEAQVIFTGSTPSNGAAIVTQYDGTATGWWLGMMDNANLAFFWTQSGSLFSTNIAFAPVPGTAYHIAAERDASNTLRLYIDGVPKRAVILSGALFNSTAPLVIGNDSRGGFKFPGVIDEVRITKAPRYSGAFTPPIAAFADNGTVDPLFGSVVLLAHFNPLPGEDHPTAGTIAAWHFDSYNPHAGGYGSQGLYMVANEADVFLITTGDSVNDGQGAYPVTFFDFYNYHIGTGNLTRVAQADWAGPAFNPQKLGQDDSATGLVGTRLHSIGSLSEGATAASRVHYCLDVSTPTAPVMLSPGDTGNYAASNTSFTGTVNQGVIIGSRAYFPASGSVYNVTSNLWSTMPTPPGVCYRPHLVVLGDNLYCLGGTTAIVNTHTGGDNLPSDAGTTYTQALWCYDPATAAWTQKADLPHPTGLHAITPRNNEASINGTRYRYVKAAYGHIFMFRDGIASIDVYNAATDTWSVKTNPVASVMSNFSDNFGTFAASGYGAAAAGNVLWFAPMFSGDLGGLAKANADLGNNYPLNEAYLNAPAINKHVLYHYFPGEDGFNLQGVAPVTAPDHVIKIMDAPTAKSRLGPWKAMQGKAFITFDHNAAVINDQIVCAFGRKRDPTNHYPAVGVVEKLNTVTGLFHHDVQDDVAEYNLLSGTAQSVATQEGRMQLIGQSGGVLTYFPDGTPPDTPNSIGLRWGSTTFTTLSGTQAQAYQAIANDVAVSIGSKVYFPTSGKVFDFSSHTIVDMSLPPSGLPYLDNPNNLLIYPTAAAVGNKIYVIGANDVTWVYDTITTTWTAAAPYPVPNLNFAKAAAIGNDIYVTGGTTDGTLDGGSDQMYAYNVITDQWTEKTPFPSVTCYIHYPELTKLTLGGGGSGRFGAFLLAVNGKLYLTGGHGDALIDYEVAAPSNSLGYLVFHPDTDPAYVPDMERALFNRITFEYTPELDITPPFSGDITTQGGGGGGGGGGSSGGTPNTDPTQGPVTGPGNAPIVNDGSVSLRALSLDASGFCENIGQGEIVLLMEVSGIGLCGNVADADAIELFFDAEGLGLAGTMSDGDAVLPEVAMAGSMEPALALTLLNMQGTALAGAVGDFDGALSPLDAYGGLEPALRLGRIGADGRMVAGTVAGGLLVLPALHAAGTSGTDGALLLSIWQTNGAALAGTLSHGVVQLTECTAAGRMLAHGQADGALTLPTLQAQGAGLSIASTKAAVTLPAVAVSGAALAGNTMTAQIAVPLLLLDSDGFADCIGTANVTLPVLRMAGALVIELPAPVFAGVVLHPRSDSAITHYVGGNFNSITSFAGLMLAAGPGGIVALAGNDDLGNPISALLVSGESDMETEQFKRILCGYANYRTDGALELTLTTDAHDDYIYPLAPRQLDDLHPARVKFGRGVNGRYWQWRLANRDGCAFALDALTLDADALKRRVGG